MGAKQEKTEIIRIASELLQASIVSTFRDDWPKRLSWAEVERRAHIADEQRKQWAIRLRNIADALKGGEE